MFTNMQIAIMLFVGFSILSVVRGVIIRRQAGKGSVNEYAKTLKGLAR